MLFENIEVYVRLSDYSYEGQLVRFATLDENRAFNYFSNDDDDYAPDDINAEVHVFINGKFVEAWQRYGSKWVKNRYTKNPEIRNVLKINPNLSN